MLEIVRSKPKRSRLTGMKKKKKKIYAAKRR